MTPLGQGGGSGLFENVAAVEMAFVVEDSMGWIVIHFSEWCRNWTHPGKVEAPLHRLHCFCLEFDGACEVQRRVP